MTLSMLARIKWVDANLWTTGIQNESLVGMESLD